MFGVVLALAGITRILEICFILRDAHTPSIFDEGAKDALVNSFQHLPPFVSPLKSHSVFTSIISFTVPSYLSLEGTVHFPVRLLCILISPCRSLLFMSATDEELRYISSLEIDHVTYSLIMLRFVLFIRLAPRTIDT